MPGLLDFMHVANTRDILNRLERVVETRQIFPLFGGAATGKTRLFHYWLHEYPLREGHHASEPAPGLCVELFKPERETISRPVYVTPVTNVLFMELAYQMSALPTAYTAELSHSRWFQPSGKLTTDRQFLALLNFVRKYFKRLKPRVVVIDNAQFLDRCALEQLMRLRSDQSRCAIVLGSTLEKNEAMADALAALRKRLPHAHHRELTRPDPALLLRMSPQEFAHEVFRLGICKPLGMQFPVEPTQAELDFQKHVVKRAWRFTDNGDWVSIENLYERFSIALDEHAPRPRTVTPDVLGAVFGAW